MPIDAHAHLAKNWGINGDGVPPPPPQKIKKGHVTIYSDVVGAKQNQSGF